jgi:hypothetical protein
MPTDLIHRIGIAAPAETIYRALTTEDGIKARRTTDVKLDTRAGGKAAFSLFIRILLGSVYGQHICRPLVFTVSGRGRNAAGWLGDWGR